MMMMTGQTSPLSLLWSLSLVCTLHGMPDQDQQSFQYQNLSSVPGGLDPTLRGLDVSHNLLRRLDLLALLPGLRILDLSYNSLELLSEQAFLNTPGLEYLNLARNNLNNHVGRNGEALRHLRGLKQLDMSLNSLDGDAAELYLSGKSSLRHLDLTGNGLTKLTPKLFAGAKSLRTLVLENNLISDIERGTFEPLTKLETLNLARNNLANVCDFKLRQVTFLNLSRNSIRVFATTHEDEEYYKLEILDLSYNSLLFLPVFPKSNGLKRLHLQHNLVGAVDNSDISPWTLVHNTSGVDHAVGNNDIYSSWRLTPLVYIDLSSNHFRSFPETLSYLASLETLNIGKNCLPDIKYNAAEGGNVGFPSLRYLDLQMNDITHVSPLFLRSLPNLETLNLQQNAVRLCAPTDRLSAIKPNVSSCVTFSQLSTLRHLNLKENGIDILYPNTFEHTPLVSLRLERNGGVVLSSGALDGLRGSLRSLGLGETNMTNSDFSLPCMTALTQLNISFNNLTDIPSGIVCSPLRELDITNNRLTSLNDSLVANISMHLSVVYISGNPFNCCDSAWLTILREANVRIPDLNQSECVTGVNGSTICLTEFLHNPSMYCLLDTKNPELSLGQVIIFILFVTTVFITLVRCARKLCCQHGSFIV